MIAAIIDGRVSILGKAHGQESTVRGYHDNFDWVYQQCERGAIRRTMSVATRWRAKTSPSLSLREAPWSAVAAATALECGRGSERSATP